MGDLRVCSLNVEDLRECWADVQLAIQARNETSPRQVTIDDLIEDSGKTFSGYVLKQLTDNGESVVGFALTIRLFSTWAGPFMSVDDFLILTKDQSLEDYFIRSCVKMAQEHSLSRLDFQVHKTDLNSSRIIDIGGKPKLEWETIRYTIPTLQELSTNRNETIHSKYNIRKATLDDVETMLYYIQMMAETFDEPDGVKVTVEDLSKWFGIEFECCVAEMKPSWQQSSNKQPATLTNGNSTNGSCKTSSMPRNPAIKGICIYKTVFCRRAGRVLHLEDVIVEPEFRSQGIGTELIKETAKAGLAQNCIEMDLQVLQSNPRAADLYYRLGGKLDNEYVITRIEDTAFEKVHATLTN